MTHDLRTHLLSLKEELMARRERARAHLEPAGEPVSEDIEELFLRRQSDEVVQALALRLDIEVAELDQALQRLEQGTFGICVHCGETIAAPRLAALPGTTRCAACASLASAPRAQSAR